MRRVRDSVDFAQLQNDLTDGQRAFQPFDHVKMYKESDMFKDCSVDFMREFLFNCGDDAWGIVVDAGIRLMTEGQVGSSMYIVHRGEVKVIIDVFFDPGVGWLPKLWKVRSRLYRSRFLQFKCHSAAFV